MKRLFLFAVTALAAIACNKSELELEGSIAPSQGTPITITVEMPSSADSKVEFDQEKDTWITKWSNSDGLSAFHYSNGGTSSNKHHAAFVIKEVSEDGKKATFDGKHFDDHHNMVMFYAGTGTNNMVEGDEVALSLANQRIVLSTTDSEGVVSENAQGALGEYSYMVSEQIVIEDIKADDYDYNTVSVKHLTALMELNLRLLNIPENQTYTLSEVQIGISEDDYSDLLEELEGTDTPVPDFVALYSKEYYDITSSFLDKDFATRSQEMGVYTLAIEGLEISRDNNTFSIPFNAFPFDVNDGQFLDITLLLTQSNEDGQLTVAVALNFQIQNTSGSIFEFPRGKHHTINYIYECDEDDFEYIWDGSTFPSVEVAKKALGEAGEDGVYYISSATQLAAVSYLVLNENDSYGSAKYALVDNIDLNNYEWTPIGFGKSFKGTFDGAGHTVSGLYIFRDEYDVIMGAGAVYSYPRGFFGITNGAIIKNLTISGSFTGKGAIAGIVAEAENSTIVNCHNAVELNGVGNTGGVVGYAKTSYIVNCSNTADIYGSDMYVGGIVGQSRSSVIANCYNTGAVVNNQYYTGGIVGYLSNEYITNCYSIGSVKGVRSGGVVGSLNEASVTNCYWASDIADAPSDGIGYVYSTYLTSNQGTTSMNIAAMRDFDFVTLLNNNAAIYNQGSPTIEAYAWVMTIEMLPVFNLDSKPSYTTVTFSGSGSAEEPYKIGTADDLRNLSNNVNVGGETYDGKYFEVAQNIDLGGVDASGDGVAVNEFIAIGTLLKPFKGKFDGSGYQVSGLYINQAESLNPQALFGYAESTIENLSVSGIVTGGSNVGAVVGYAAAEIVNCHSSATVNGASNVGGVVGCTSAGVINCYNDGSIIGTGDYVGGIVGFSLSSSNNCYNAGAVSGASTTYYLGGVAGYAVTVSNCYYDSEVCEVSDNSATAMKTGEMQAVDFLVTLNNNAYNYNNPTSGAKPTNTVCAWVAVDGGYPVLLHNEVPTFTQVLFSGGNGTAASPYLIKTVGDMESLASVVNNGESTFEGKYLKVVNNISLGGSESNQWTPIGKSSSESFKGVFDGAGYEISGLYINSTADNSYQALFGYVSAAIIKNLSVVGSVTVNAEKVNAAGVVAYASAITTIINCSNSATINANVNLVGSSYSGNVGGVVGYAYGSVVNSYNLGEIAVTYTYSASSSSTYSVYVGGVVGNCFSNYSEFPSYANNCYNVASVTATNSSASVGGVLGRGRNASIIYCYWASNITGTPSNGVGSSSAYCSVLEVTGMTSVNMQVSSFLDVLNTNVLNYIEANKDLEQPCGWSQVQGSYPYLDFDITVQ